MAVDLANSPYIVFVNLLARVCTVVTYNYSKNEGSLSKEGFHGTHGTPSRSATVIAIVASNISISTTKPL